MKMGTTRSPKFRRLSRMTGMSARETVGTLELLWLFAMEQAPAGDVGKWPDDELEEVCDWDGESGALITALVETGWLDECGTHRLLIHDWADHLPEFLRLRIHRKSLVLAERSPTPDRTYDERTPTARRGVGVDREGKGREAMPREGKKEAPPASQAARSSSIGKGPRPDVFEGDARERILRWAAEKGFSQEILRAGLERFREWTPLDKKNRDMDQWVSAFMRVVREGVEKGQLVDKRKPAGLAYRSADDVLAEAKRKQAEDDARARSETPEAIGQLIDLSLRQANGAA